MKKSFMAKSVAFALATLLCVPFAFLKAEEESKATTEAQVTTEGSTKESASEVQSSEETKEATTEASPETSEAQAEKSEYSFDAQALLSQQMMLAVDWWQNSGEMRALFLQGYALAKLRLDEALKNKGDKPLAIALDLDETVLDNGPYQAQCIKDGTGFEPKSWDEWCLLKTAKAVPGAKDFLNYADEQGVQIYYISDRGVNVLEATIENLKAEGIPVQGEDHVMLKDPEDKTGKVARREKVTEQNELIMLFGDNLNDFEEFSKKDLTERLNKVEELQAEFGAKFIVFPNPMYGSFESAIYGPDKLDAAGKLAAREKALKPIK